jgi:hypothetical protein
METIELGTALESAENIVKQTKKVKHRKPVKRNKNRIKMIKASRKTNRYK